MTEIIVTSEALLKMVHRHIPDTKHYTEALKHWYNFYDDASHPTQLH
jgi:hypothetical protein